MAWIKRWAWLLWFVGIGLMLWVWWSTSPGGVGVAAAMPSVHSVFSTLGGLAAVGLLILGYFWFCRKFRF